MHLALSLVLLHFWRVSGEEFKYQECADSSIWKRIKKSNKGEGVFEERFLKKRTGYTLLPDVVKNSTCAKDWKLCVTFIGNIKHCGICLNPHPASRQFYNESQCAQNWESQYQNRLRHGMKKCDGNDKEWLETTWGELFQVCLGGDGQCFCNQDKGFGSCQMVQKQHCTGCIHDGHMYKSNSSILANCTSGTQNADGFRFYFPEEDNFPQNPNSRQNYRNPNTVASETSITTTTEGHEKSTEILEELRQEQNQTPELAASGKQSDDKGSGPGVIMVAVSSCLGTLVVVLVLVIIGMRIRKKREQSKIVEIDKNPEYAYYQGHAEIRDNNIYYADYY